MGGKGKFRLGRSKEESWGVDMQTTASPALNTELLTYTVSHGHD